MSDRDRPPRGGHGQFGVGQPDQLPERVPEHWTPMPDPYDVANYHPVSDIS